MQRLSSIRRCLQLLVRGKLSVLWRQICRRLYSQTHSFGLRRDLYVTFDPPPAEVSLQIRPLTPADLPTLLALSNGPCAGTELNECLGREHLLHSGLTQCYIAETSDGKPCYMQWLMSPDENERVLQVFGGLFPWLQPNEALLEGAYTFPALRGKGIMACAMAHIAEKAADLGARFVITFVDEHNLASLKGCKKAGFVPYLWRTESWFLFCRRVTLKQLSPGTPYPFERPALSPASQPLPA